MAESPTLESLPKVDADLKSELESFKPSLMKSVSTTEKVVLPSAEDVAAEKTQEAIKKGIEDFDQNNLKHTKTQEKIVLPDAEVIESEKGQIKFREGIETFDPKNMKHVETQEKNPLPTKEIIDQEKQVWAKVNEHLIPENFCLPPYELNVKDAKSFVPISKLTIQSNFV